MNTRPIIILNYGERTPDSLARRIRDFSVFSEILPIDFAAEKIRKIDPIGIILSGSEIFIPQKDAPLPDRDIYKLGIPILAVENGALIMTHQLGGKIKFSEMTKPGWDEVRIDPDCPLFVNLEPVQEVYFDSSVQIENIPNGFKDIAFSDLREHAAFADESNRLYAAQFSPDPAKTNPGKRILDRFLFQICGADGSFTLDTYLKNQIKTIKKAVGKEKIILGLSGGVNSAVVAAILSAAVPKQLTCVLVDHGMMRKNEADEIERAFRGKSLNIIRVDASARFYKKLSDVGDPDKKRKIIEEQFYKVFAKQAERIGGVKILALGTIYPDLIADGINKVSPVRAQHTVRELPKDAGFKELVEPLRFLFKDEVRKLGRMLGLPEEIISRPSFPASGLALRVFGGITREKIEAFRDADAILTRELSKVAPFPNRVSAVLTDLQAIDPEASSDSGKFALVLRSCPAEDYTHNTGEPIQLPLETCRRIARSVFQGTDAVKRVVLDLKDDSQSFRSDFQDD